MVTEYRHVSFSYASKVGIFFFNKLKVCGNSMLSDDG